MRADVNKDKLKIRITDKPLELKKRKNLMTNIEPECSGFISLTKFQCCLGQSTFK